MKARDVRAPVSLSASGSGVVFAQLSWRYHLKADDSKPAFVCSAKEEPSKTESEMSAQLCCRYNRAGESGMAVLEAGALSGFEFDYDATQALTEQQSLQRAELTKGGTQANLYFESVTHGQSGIKSRSGQKYARLATPKSCRVYFVTRLPMFAHFSVLKSGQSGSGISRIETRPGAKIRPIGHPPNRIVSCRVDFVTRLPMYTFSRGLRGARRRGTGFGPVLAGRPAGGGGVASAPGAPGGGRGGGEKLYPPPPLSSLPSPPGLTFAAGQESSVRDAEKLARLNGRRAEAGSDPPLRLLPAA